MACEKLYPAASQWPERKPSPLTLVKQCAKRAGLFAVLNLVLFWWQQADLLADQAAIPAMWVCALLGGVELGKCIAKGLRDA